MLALFGGALGAVIGPVGFWLRGMDATERLRERTGRSGAAPALDRLTALDAVGMSPPQIVFMLLAFLSTAALMPLLIRWLEQRATRSAGPYYARAAIGGVVFGTGATVLTAMGIVITLLIVGAVGPAEGGARAGPTTLGGMAAGVAVFAPLVGITTPFLFIKWIVLFGVPFGLVFGTLVRQLRHGGPRH